jgi:hypothetical protein
LLQSITFASLEWFNKHEEVNNGCEVICNDSIQVPVAAMLLAGSSLELAKELLRRYGLRAFCIDWAGAKEHCGN